MEISLPIELLKEVDELLELVGFRSREEFAEAAVRRLVDLYAVMVIRDR